ncbi:MAG: WYL domain-containing protein [Oscillospiraceae bacterium]|nr:WYL domain-containing protein [Oscillospiraceae bacterium]MBQ9148249.1 WYL domain-containing protein [Oscillospiraceae bacterium]
MNFSSLKYSQASYEAGDITRIENKQRVSLSSHAYSILLHDMDIFQAASGKEGEISSELINHIFVNFHSQAESSLATALQNRHSYLMEHLCGMGDASARAEAVGLLLKAYSAELEQHRKERCALKNHTQLFRVSKKNLDYLMSDDGQREGAYHRDNVGAYFKAVLEEYCEHPYAERERIYCKQYVDEIELAILNRMLLRIETRNKHVAYMKPLELGRDPERLYNYLVGLMATGPDGHWEIASIRLSSITSCERRAQSGFISAETEKIIRSAIKQVGIQYLADNDSSERIVVEFTPQGEKLYRSILHLRPQYTQKTDRVYEFNCSMQQADNYFFKFGHNARILEPKSLADKFRRKYENAAKKYISV